MEQLEFAFNRTIVELKSHMTDVGLADSATFNRTIVELKSAEMTRGRSQTGIPLIAP